MRIESEYVEYVPATAGDVLAVFRDDHRHVRVYNPVADPEIDLAFDSTVRDWELACDLLPWWDVCRAMNEVWNIARNEVEWESVLNPAEKRTLRDVCEFVAETATAPRFRPMRIAGVERRPAGAFLALRDILTAAGADGEAIAPSTPIADYLDRHAWQIIRAGHAVPGAVPTIVVPPADGRDLALLAATAVSCIGSIAAGLFAVVELDSLTPDAMPSRPERDG